jgi:hypothetical protein
MVQNRKGAETLGQAVELEEGAHLAPPSPPTTLSAPGPSIIPSPGPRDPSGSSTRALPR